MSNSDVCYAAMAIAPSQPQPVFYFQAAPTPELAWSASETAVKEQYGNDSQMVALFNREHLEQLLANITLAEQQLIERSE